LVALARKAEFETDLSLRDWFWIFLDNLGIAELSDARRNVSRKVAEVIDILIWRTYRDDGRGGMFPLRRPAQDQTKVELWYQLNEYLVENDIF
jgi:hypothetical protein